MFDHRPDSLNQRTLIRVSGDDAKTFLQGQLTQDMEQVHADNFRWAAHCSPKGRVLFTALVWSQGEDFFLETCPGQTDFILSRLRPFVLRARVTLTDVRADWKSVGWVDQDLSTQVRSWSDHPLPAPGQHQWVDGVHRLRLSETQLLLVGPATALPPHDDHAPSPSAHWDLANLQQGIVEIQDATRDQFIPQWLNWDLIGGISFKKGCYTGQEIVARTHFLGKVARRTRYLTAPQPVSLHTPVFSAAQTVGTIIACVPNNHGGADLLAVLQQGAEPPLSIADPLIPLTSASLPYSIPD
ncbi:MAG: hypothetical protein M0Z78_02230 [Betaproteobacteria bacterium]|nr:hypothetical protein [Betaproteobacteria bacterium]